MTIERELPGDEGSSGSEVRDENPNRAERIDDRPARDERHPRDRDAGREPGRTMRDTLRKAIKEHEPTENRAGSAARPERSAADRRAAGSDKPRETETGKFAPRTDKTEDRGEKTAASPDVKPNSEAKTGETAPPIAAQTQSAIAAPATAPKEVAAIWDKLPQEAQAVFAKREADMLKGVEQIKSELKPLKDAFAPVRGQLQQLGATEAQAAERLISWQAALANPATQLQAFRDLARLHKLDLSTLTGSQAPAAVADGQNSQPDISQQLRPLLDPLQQKISQFESHFQQQQVQRVQNDISTFSQGKPHFEKVSVAMGHLMQSGLAKGSTPKEIFDDAYERACRADPEVFATIRQEEDAKRQADAVKAQEAQAAKAEEEKRKQAEAVAKARKASVGLRAGSPAGMAIAAKTRGTSVRDSLNAAIRESGAAI